MGECNQTENTSCCNEEVNEKSNTWKQITYGNAEQIEVELRQEVKNLKIQLDQANETICEKLELYSDLQAFIIELYLRYDIGTPKDALIAIGTRIQSTLEKYTKK